jgi:hypothetical protein
MKETVKYFKGNQLNVDNTAIFDPDYNTKKDLSLSLNCSLKRLEHILFLIYITNITIRIGFDWGLISINLKLNIAELVLLSILFTLGLYLWYKTRKQTSCSRESLKFLLFSSNLLFLTLLLPNHSQFNSQFSGCLNISRIVLSLYLSTNRKPLKQVHPSPSAEEILSSLRNDKSLKSNKPFLSDLSKLLSNLSSQAKFRVTENLLSEPPETFSNLSTIKELENIDLITFNIFTLRSQTSENELLTIQKFIFETYDFSGLSFRLFEFLSFSLHVQNGYLSNSYHNATHAADVVQSIHLMLGPFHLRLRVSPGLVSALLVGGAVHDFQHPGKTNAFLVKTSDRLAMTYNDISVLENFHVSSALDLLQSSQNCNFLQDVDLVSFTSFRRDIIKIVLATDFNFHSQHLNRCKAISSDEELTLDDQIALAELIMHSSDILNPARPWETCQKWTSLLFEEYFAQGDTEKSLGLPISHLCDRNSVTISATQVFFINSIVTPTIIVLHQFSSDFQILLKNLQNNLELWTLFLNNSNNS